MMCTIYCPPVKMAGKNSQESGSVRKQIELFKNTPRKDILYDVDVRLQGYCYFQILLAAVAPSLNNWDTVCSYF